MNPLSALQLPDIQPGLSVLSAKGTLGRVLYLAFDTRYSKEDPERNPLVTLVWENGATSCQPLAYLDKVQVLESPFSPSRSQYQYDFKYTFLEQEGPFIEQEVCYAYMEFISPENEDPLINEERVAALWALAH